MERLQVPSHPAREHYPVVRRMFKACIISEKQLRFQGFAKTHCVFYAHAFPQEFHGCCPVFDEVNLAIFSCLMRNNVKKHCVPFSFKNMPRVHGVLSNLYF